MNPWQDNPLQGRADFARSVVQLWEPLKPFFSPGRARVSLARTGAHFTEAAAELEGFARPLFGLGPLAAGGLPFDDWDMVAEGFANGLDPDHEEYWGDPYDVDQRLVESAAIGLGLLLAKDKLWDPLPADRKDKVARWLLLAQTRQVADNNWHFFHVLGSLGLSHCGVDHDLSVRMRALDRLEQFYEDDGWYTDGDTRRFDHYVPFAMHYYALIYAALAPEDAERATRFRDRAAVFARDFRDWFAADGASVPYGRSMTYRFAQGAFWGALAFAGVEALPWGEIRGLWARHLRWWSAHDYFDRDGICPVGYLYPNYLMSERYNSPGSPYWNMKAFLPLALPDSHPFWTADEAPRKDDGGKVATSWITGSLSFETGGNRVLMPSSSEMRYNQRGAAEKYGKFAYSSGFGFSLDHDREAFLNSPFDNSIAFSRNYRTFSIRNDIDDARIGEGWNWTRWSPEPGIEVQTWVIAQPPWHLRAHLITASEAALVIEGGFAIERTDSEHDELRESEGLAMVRAGRAVSMALDWSPVPRRPRVLKALPNSSLYFPRTHVPQLGTRIAPGETWLIGAFAAGFDVRPADWLALCPPPLGPRELVDLLSHGKKIHVMQRREKEASHNWTFDNATNAGA